MTDVRARYLRAGRRATTEGIRKRRKEEEKKILRKNYSGSVYSHTGTLQKTSLCEKMDERDERWRERDEGEMEREMRERWRLRPGCRGW